MENGINKGAIFGAALAALASGAADNVMEGATGLSVLPGIQGAEAACYGSKEQCMQAWEKADTNVKRNVARGPRKKVLAGASCSQLSDYYDKKFREQYKEWVKRGKIRSVEECATICQLKKDELHMARIKCKASQTVVWRIKAQINRFCIKKRKKNKRHKRNRSYISNY